MVSESPAAVLFSRDGYDVVITDGYTITASRPGIIAAGKDGSAARFILVDSTGAVKIDPTGSTSQPVTGTVAATQSGIWTVQPGNTANTTPWLITINQGGNSATVTASNALKVDGSAVTQPISATSLPLPTGAATEATLTNLLLDATFTSRINTLGQKTMANSTPIVIASDQSVIPISDNGSSITIDGTITANIGTTNGLALDATLTNGTQKTIITNGTNDGYVLNSAPSGTEYGLVVRNIPSGTQAISGTVAATQSGTWTVQQGTPPWSVSQSGTWTVQPGNTANITPWLITINEGGNSATVTASNALKVDGSAVTQPVSAVSWPLPTGAATEATLATLLTEATFAARINTLGQKTMASSTPIVIASDQSAIPVSQNGTWTVQQGTPPWSVVGPGAAGAAIAGDPVRIGASDGALTRNILSDAGGRLQIVGASASGAAVAGNPVLIGGSDGTNARTIKTSTDGTIITDQGLPNTLANRWPVIITDGTNTGPTMDAAARAGYVRITDGTNTIGTLFKTLYSDPNGDRRTIHNNATITSSGSSVLTWVGYAEWYLVINLKNAPTGTSPTIQFKIEQVDPIDQTTVLTGVRVFTGTLMNTSGVDVIEVPELISDTVKISWTVTGAGASWTGVNVTFCGHASGNAIEGQADVGTVADDPPVPVAGTDGDGYIRYLNVDAAGNLKVVTQIVSGDATTGLVIGAAILGGGTSGTLQPIRATTYNTQSVNAQRSIASANANDNSAGTGARTVRITYLDASGNGPYSEVITMNGTTAVNTVATNICYIEKMEVETTGTLGYNAGVITLYVSTGGTGGTIGTIGVGTTLAGQGDNRTFWGHHYVPLGKEAEIATITTSTAGSVGASFFMRARVIGVNEPDIQVSEFTSNSASFTRTLGIPLKVMGPTRLLMYGIPSTNNVTLYASFDFSEQ